MKKLITLLIFLFAGVALAQTYTPYDKTEGRYWRAYKDTLLASYVYVVNDSTSLAHLDSLVADLATSKGYLLDIKTNGDSLIVLVNSTNTKLDNVITDLDSLVLLTTNIYGAVDGVETKLDSLDASSTRIETKLDNANVKLDSLDASSTRIEGYVDGVEGELGAIKDTLSSSHTTLIAIKNKDFATETTLGETKDTLSSAHTTLIAIKNKDFSTEATLGATKDTLSSAHTTLITMKNNQTDGDQKTQIVDGSGNVIGATSNALDVNVKSGSLSASTTFVSGNIAITTAAQLHSNTACKKVTITNYTAGEYVFVGNASVSTSNGFPLGYLDSITLTVSNLNLVYVVSDGTSCDIRFSYEN